MTEMRWWVGSLAIAESWALEPWDSNRWRRYKKVRFTAVKSKSEPTTFLGNIMAGLFATGKNIDREKFDGIFENLPHYPGHVFPYDFSFKKMFRITTYF